MRGLAGCGSSRATSIRVGASFIFWSFRNSGGDPGRPPPWRYPLSPARPRSGRARRTAGTSGGSRPPGSFLRRQAPQKLDHRFAVGLARGFCAFSSSRRDECVEVGTPWVVSLRKNWRALFTLVGGRETTSGNIESPRMKKSCLPCLQAWPVPSSALSHLARGHTAQSPPGVPRPIKPSADEHCGGTLPASLLG